MCHGEAGLPQITIRVNQLHPDHELATAADALAQRLRNAFDRAAPFGFRHQLQRAELDEPGLLHGATGVALTLATFAGATAVPGIVAWDSPLLLS